MSHDTTAHRDDTDDRELGVEFGDLGDELGSVDYPLSLEELLDEHGDAELVLGEETTTLREVLEPLGEDEYESAEEVNQAVLTMVDSEAVGREHYSDRGGTDAGEDTETDESF